MDQGLRKFKQYLVVSNKYRFVFRHLRRGNSSSCDIEHTDLKWKPLCEKQLAGPLNTHRRRAQLSAFKHTAGTTLEKLKLASNGRILIRKTFQSQAQIGHPFWSKSSHNEHK